MTGYNLLNEPWIPCETSDGAILLGIRAALADAHTIREIRTSSPLATVALHRLLLAILHRVFGPRNLDAWCDLWNRGQWDVDALSAYFTIWEQRFDLLDPSKPFYQVPPLIQGKDALKKSSPAARLAQEHATGNNATLFDHQVDGDPVPLSLPVATQQLLATQMFAIGFGKSQPFYLKDASLTRGYSVLCVGHSLFETLALNLVPYNAQRPIPHLSDSDRPAWEEETPREPSETGTTARGYLDYLTWQSRRVHLISSNSASEITHCQIQQNFFLAVDVTDPFRCYRFNEATGRSVVGFNAERSLWRDAQVLFHRQYYSTRDKRITTTRPQLFEHLVRVDQRRQDGMVKTLPVYRIDAFGFATEDGRAAQITFWRHEKLPLPLVYLDDASLLATMDSAIKYAEQVGNALRSATRRFVEEAFPSLPESRGKRDENPHVRALGPGRRYWPALDTAFAAFLVAQAEEHAASGATGQISVGPAFRAWADAARQAAVIDFRTIVGSQDATTRVLRARVVAEQVFYGALKRARDAAGVTAEEEANDDA